MQCSTGKFHKFLGSLKVPFPAFWHHFRVILDYYMYKVYLKAKFKRTPATLPSCFFLHIINFMYIKLHVICISASSGIGK